MQQGSCYKSIEARDDCTYEGNPLIWHSYFPLSRDCFYHHLLSLLLELYFNFKFTLYYIVRLLGYIIEGMGSVSTDH